MYSPQEQERKESELTVSSSDHRVLWVEALSARIVRFNLARTFSIIYKWFAMVRGPNTTRARVVTLNILHKRVKLSLTRIFSKVGASALIRIYQSGFLSRSRTSECKVGRSRPDREPSERPESEKFGSRSGFVGGKQQLASSDLHVWHFTLLQGMTFAFIFDCPTRFVSGSRRQDLSRSSQVQQKNGSDHRDSSIHIERTCVPSLRKACPRNPV